MIPFHFVNVHTLCSGEFSRMLRPQEIITKRSETVGGSGIREIFELAATMKDPINLSIGQPDFDVPDPVKVAAVEAIHAGHNKYTPTNGAPEIRKAVAASLKRDLGWDIESDPDLEVTVTSGTSGGLVLTYLTFTEPGDEMIIPDPYFVIYPAAATIAGSKAVYCDTYPDFRMTASRIEPLITDKTKFVLINSPSNPCGVTLTEDEVREIVDLCKAKNVLLISDEIYDQFTFSDGRDSQGRYPSPARFSKDLIVLRGFSKSYAMTGWRLGYAAGPKDLIDAMSRMQQFTFVCAPSMVQYAGATALDTDISKHVADYERKRDMVVEALTPYASMGTPTGAFYAFIEVPERLGMTGMEFVQKAVERNLLMIPGGAFSRRDTHFRMSYATTDEKLRQGLDIIIDLLKS